MAEVFEEGVKSASQALKLNSKNAAGLVPLKRLQESFELWAR